MELFMNIHTICDGVSQCAYNLFVDDVRKCSHLEFLISTFDSWISLRSGEAIAFNFIS